MLKRLLITAFLVVAFMVPLATPVYADDLFAYLVARIDELERENNRLRGLLGDAEDAARVSEPLVHIATPQNITVEPGDVIELEVLVRNIGSGSAHNFLSTASVSATAPFLVEFLNNTNRIPSMGINVQRPMRMRITVDENATPGTTSVIEFTHRFNNANGAPASTTDAINVRIVGEDPGVHNVRLSNLQASTTTVGPDQSFTVTATLANIGAGEANNIQVSIANLDADAIFLTSDLNQAFFASLEPDEYQQVSFTFRTARNVASGTLPINFRITYDGVAEGRPVIPFFVNVLADYTTTSPNIELSNLSAPTGLLNVGQTGRINFELTNTGDAVAYDIRIEASPIEGSGLVPSMSNVQTLRTLAVGATQSFEFGFMPTQSAGHHSHPVRIRVEYTIRGAGGEPAPFVQYVALNVNNPEPIEEDDDDDDTPGRVQIPRVIVSSYMHYPQIPRAGQNFDMEITFLNTSSVRSVNNIMIELEAQAAAVAGGTAGQVGSAVFTPIGGSNTLFVPFLAPGESITKTLTMFTVPDAAPRMYTLQVNLDYQDEDFYPHDLTQLLNIPVAQISRLETQPPYLQIMPFMDMFGFADFEFRILNTGRVDLRNVRVRVDGNFDVSEANDYMGNLAVGRTNQFRGRIRPLEPGLQTGAIVIYGEDEAGDIVYIEHAFEIEVQGGHDEMGDGMGMGGGFFDEYGNWIEMDGMRDGFFDEDGMWREGGGDHFPGMRDDGMFGDEGEGGFLNFIRQPVFWGPVAGVVVALIAVVVIVVKRKGNRLDFDDN